MKRSLFTNVVIAVLLSVSSHPAEASQLAVIAKPAPAAQSIQPAQAVYSAPAAHSTQLAQPGLTPLATDKKPELVDINSAPKNELIKLPGVGAVIADKIIAGRPWQSKYDLVVKKVVARNVYDKFAKLIIARQ